MSTAEKIIEKMRRQPNGIRPEEAEKILKEYGYEAVRQKGSHKHYLNKATGDLITIKQENPLKKAQHQTAKNEDEYAESQRLHETAIHKNSSGDE